MYVDRLKKAQKAGIRQYQRYLERGLFSSAGYQREEIERLQELIEQEERKKIE